MNKLSIQDDFARAVHDYLLIEKTALMPADFGLIFGNKNIIKPLANQAAKLYHEGQFPLIVASGGIKVNGRSTEADALRSALRKKGVPDSAILLERQSTHTGENVQLTRALLEKEGLADKMTTVIGIGHIIAARRFMMTLERHWPELHKMHISVNPFNSAVKDWHYNEKFRKNVLQEWRKISPYQADDKIREIDTAYLDRVTRALRAMRTFHPDHSTPENLKIARKMAPTML